MNKIEEALEFANKKFSENRKGNHFEEVYTILKNEFDVEDTELLIAGILHDTLEDTNATYDELSKTFSKEIADLVNEVSHAKGAYDHEQYYNNLKTISLKAKTIKFADFTSHLRNFIKIYEKNRQHKYPKFVNNDKYVYDIQDFLDSCPDSKPKRSVYELSERLKSLL